MSDSNSLQFLPRYRSHKVVQAVKVTDVLLVKSPDGGAVLVAEEAFTLPEGAGRLNIPVTNEWMAKHNPQPPGYLVVYEDGYRSWSPVESFESGYVRLGAGRFNSMALLAGAMMTPPGESPPDIGTVSDLLELLLAVDTPGRESAVAHFASLVAAMGKAPVPVRARTLGAVHDMLAKLGSGRAQDPATSEPPHAEQPRPEEAAEAV